MQQSSGRGREKRDEIAEVISSEAPYQTGRKFTPHFTDGIKLEMIVSDSIVKLIVHEIIATLSNGLASDGRIFVKDVSDGYDIGSKKGWDATCLIDAD